MELIDHPRLEIVTASNWKDYELIDSGGGRKLERYGKFILNRPEPEALWKRKLSQNIWQEADATYSAEDDQNSGSWQKQTHMPDQWKICYGDLKFTLQLSSSRHIGVFPEQAAQWEWINDQLISAKRPIKVLNLFGYTAIASLAAARVGAKVTHVDASNKALQWAKQNQAESKLAEAPIRWILDDALKFIRREVRRGSLYDGLILDPPKFGRGPKGEVWEFYKLIPELLDLCRQVLTPRPLFVVLTAYAVKASPITLFIAVSEMMQNYHGEISVGETVLVEKSGGRMISTAMYVRWNEH